MTMERVPGRWQASQGVGAEGDDAASASNVTHLSYDVDHRQSKTPRPDSKWPTLNDDDSGTNCLANGLEMTVLSNLPGPDYALCVEPFVPFELLPREGLNQRLKDAVERAEHRQVSTSAGPVPAEHAPANTGPRSSIKKKRRRVSLQAAFGGSRNVWEGISAANRERRRPSDLVASPAPLLCAGKTGPGSGPAAADKERKLGGCGIGMASGDAPAPFRASKPNFLSDDSDSDSDSDSSCFSDGAASSEESKLQEDFHRKFHQELSRTLEFEQHGGHKGRCIKVPELKPKRKACLPHWHCSNSIRVTSDRMSLGLPPEPMLPLHLPLDGVRLGGAPLTGNDSIPPGGDTYALVSERARDDDDHESDSNSDSSSTCSSSDSDSAYPSPSRRRAHTFHRGVRPSPGPVPAGKLGMSIAGVASCNNESNSKKQPEGRSSRAHLYLKPMLPREAVQRPPADHHGHGGGAGAGTRKAPPATGPQGRLSPWPAHRPMKVPQTPPALPAAPGGWVQQSGPESRASSRASSRAASPAPVQEAREIRIGPWNSLSPRTDLLGCAAPGGAGNVGNGSGKEQCGAFCFNIPLPGERSLLVRAETGPKQVHISVSLQDVSGELDGTLLAERDRVCDQQRHGEQNSQAQFSTPSCKNWTARKRSVSWSCPEILGPGVAPSATRPPPPARSRGVPVSGPRAASPASWNLPLQGPVRREPSPVSWNISVQGGAAARTPSPPCDRPDCGQQAEGDHGHADVTTPLQALTPVACPSAIPAQDLAYQHLEAVVVESSDGSEHTVLLEPSNDREPTVLLERSDERELTVLLKPGDGGEPSPPKPLHLSEQHLAAVSSLHEGMAGLVSCRNIQVQPGVIRDILDCQNAASFQEVKAVDVAVVAVARCEQDDHKRRTSDLKFSKSNHNFLEKLARKAGSGDPHCVRALKPFQEEAGKENECGECEPQKCSRRCCRMGASQSHRILVGAQKELPKAQVSAHSQTENGIPLDGGKTHWLSLFKRAIRQKSKEFNAYV